MEWGIVFALVMAGNILFARGGYLDNAGDHLPRAKR